MEQPIFNVQLTADQINQLDIFEKRLNNLHQEREIAIKLLGETRIDCERIERDRLYQENILEGLNTQVATKQSTATKLDEEILVKSGELAILNSTINESKIQHEKTVMLLKDREDKISAKELELSIREEKTSKERTILNNDKAEHNQKVAKLKVVISTF